MRVDAAWTVSKKPRCMGLVSSTGKQQNNPQIRMFSYNISQVKKHAREHYLEAELESCQTTSGSILRYVGLRCGWERCIGGGGKEGEKDESV